MEVVRGLGLFPGVRATVILRLPLFFGGPLPFAFVAALPRAVPDSFRATSFFDGTTDGLEEAPFAFIPAILTNGTLFDGENMRLLVEGGYFFSISVDSP